MSADTSGDGSRFPAGSVERLLDEYRATHDAVRAVFRVEIGEPPEQDITVETLEAVAETLHGQVCFVFGDEYVHCRVGDDGPEWYSMKQMRDRMMGPIALYQRNVATRLEKHPLGVERTDSTPFAGVDLPSHDLDASDLGGRGDV